MDLKEDGHAGLLYAYNSHGDYTAATEAVSGEKYTCPICGCAMHLATITKTGKKFFARNPNNPHKDPRCITIERSGVEHTFKDLDPQKFITALCHVVPRRDAAQRKPGTTDSESESSKDETTELRLVKFASLKQIAESGIKNLKADDMEGDHKVSDFVITYNYGQRFFTDPNFELGARIVYAAYDSFISGSNTLVFSMFSKQANFSVKFHLIFIKKTDFYAFRDKFGNYVEDKDGKTKFIKKHKHQTVLIASDNWEKIVKPYCKDNCNNDYYCKSCCGIYQAVYQNSKQLYLLPADD